MSKWEKVRLGEVGEVVTGKTPPTNKSEYYSSNDIAFYKPNDITESVPIYLESATSYLSQSAKSVVRIIPKGSVLVTCIGIIGKVGITQRESTCNQQINAVIPNGEIINNMFLAFCLLNNRSRITDMANSAVVPIIKKSRFMDVEIPLPPLQTQQQIAKTLDSVSKLLDMRKQQLTELDNLIKSVFYEMFGDPVVNAKGWEVVQYKNILVEKPQNGMFAKNSEYSEDGRCGVIWIGDFINKRICDLSNLRTINASQKDIEKYSVEYGDLLFVRSSLTREGIGKCSIVPIDINENILFECHIIRTRVNLDLINPVFLQAQSTTRYFRQQILTNSKTSTMTTIGQDGIISTLIILPPITLQNQFADIVAKIEEEKALVKQAIDETQYLFDSMMSQYFDD